MVIFNFYQVFATGASWLCYFKALQLGYVNKVVPIDKSSTILTMILAFIFLKEEMTLLKGVCVILIGDWYIYDDRSKRKYISKSS